ILGAAGAVGDSGVVVHARAALDTLLRRVYARGRAVRHVAGAGSPVRALLEDQVQVAWACLAAREATGETRYLEIAEDLVRLLEREFADSGSAGYFDAAATDPTAPALADRAKPVLDDLLPGGNGWAGRVLLRLPRLTGRGRGGRELCPRLPSPGELPGADAAPHLAVSHRDEPLQELPGAPVRRGCAARRRAARGGPIRHRGGSGARGPAPPGGTGARGPLARQA